MRLPAMLALAALVVAVAAPPSPLVRCAEADGLLPGEAAELTPQIRTTAQQHVDVILKSAEGAPECPKAVRALLVLGPAIWPVLENALRLNPPDGARPHINYLKALLLKKADPDFEALRDAIRRKVLTNTSGLIASACLDFRLGRPDPAQRGKRIPLVVKPTKTGQDAQVYRCPDGTMVIVFGIEGDPKIPDAGDFDVDEPAAGFVAGIAGKPRQAEGSSGRGGSLTVRAPMGFAYAWASDGADGVKPDGSGGEGGTAEAHGGAGEWTRSGKGGKGAGG